MYRRKLGEGDWEVAPRKEEGKPVSDITEVKTKPFSKKGGVSSVPHCPRVSCNKEQRGAMQLAAQKRCLLGKSSLDGVTRTEPDQGELKKKSYL